MPPTEFKSVLTTRSCETFSPVAFVLQPVDYKPGIHGHLTCLRKQPQEKQTGELLATMHARMDCIYRMVVKSVC